MSNYPAKMAVIIPDFVIVCGDEQSGDPGRYVYSARPKRSSGTLLPISVMPRQLPRSLATSSGIYLPSPAAVDFRWPTSRPLPPATAPGPRAGTMRSLSIRFNPSTCRWQTLADPACDPALKAAVEANPLPYRGDRIKVQLEGNNKDLRRLLTTHGANLSKAKTNDKRLAQDGIAFHTGRSGRTHFRWVFEIPVEFTADQRKMVLEDLCAHSCTR